KEKGTIAPNSAIVKMTQRLTWGACEEITERIMVKRYTSWIPGSQMPTWPANLAVRFLFG
ncbi:MAG TPA: hypothetical protein VIX42_04750, partial [Edaphobacter sp.]